MLAFALILPACPPARAENGLAHFDRSCGHLCTNADIFGNGGDSAANNARKAEDEGKQLGNQARDKGRLGDQIGKDLGGLRNSLSQVPPNPPAEARQKKEAILAKPYQPPKEFREAVKKLELNTNRDLNDKGEKVQKQVYTEAKALLQQSQAKLADAKKSAAGARQLHALQGETLKRSAAMRSADDVNIIKPSVAGANAGTNLTLASSGSPAWSESTRPQGLSGPGGANSEKDGGLPLTMARSGQLESGRLALDSAESQGDKPRDLKQEADDKFMSQLNAMDKDLSRSLGMRLDAVQGALQIADGGAGGEPSRGPASLGGGHSTGEEPQGQEQGANRLRTSDASLFHRVHDCHGRQQKRGNLLAGAANDL